MRKPPKVVNNKKAPKTKAIQIYAQVKIGSGYRQLEETVELPVSVKDAIKIYGEDQVLKLFLDSLIVSLQAKMRYAAKPRKARSRGILDLLRED